MSKTNLQFLVTVTSQQNDSFQVWNAGDRYYMKAKFLEGKSPSYQPTVPQFALSKICQWSAVNFQRKLTTPQVTSKLVDGPDNSPTLAFNVGVSPFPVEEPTTGVENWMRLTLEVLTDNASNACRTGIRLHCEWLRQVRQLQHWIKGLYSLYFLECFLTTIRSHNFVGHVLLG